MEIHRNVAFDCQSPYFVVQSPWFWGWKHRDVRIIIVVSMVILWWESHVGSQGRHLSPSLEAAMWWQWRPWQWQWSRPLPRPGSTAGGELQPGHAVLGRWGGGETSQSWWQAAKQLVSVGDVHGLLVRLKCCHQRQSRWTDFRFQLVVWQMVMFVCKVNLAKLSVWQFWGFVKGVKIWLLVRV